MRWINRFGIAAAGIIPFRSVRHRRSTSLLAVVVAAGGIACPADAVPNWHQPAEKISAFSHVACLHLSCWRASNPIRAGLMAELDGGGEEDIPATPSFPSVSHITPRKMPHAPSRKDVTLQEAFPAQGHAKPANRDERNGLSQPLPAFGSVPIKVASAHLEHLTRDAMAPFKAIRGGCGGSRPATQSAPCDQRFPVVWRRALEGARQLQGVEQLSWVNTHVNRLLHYRSDRVAHGRDDVWSPPLESMNRGAGDCEDYALVKMWFLRTLGVEADQMHIVVVDRTGSNARHAVLAVKLGSAAYILDSRSTRIAVEDEVKDYVPVFSVGQNDIWLHGKASPVSLAALP